MAARNKMAHVGYDNAVKPLRKTGGGPFCTAKNRKKNSFFKKRTGEVVENTGKQPKTNRKRTGNEATKLVENKGLAKKTNRKRTGNEPGHVVENKGWSKNEPETNRKIELETASAHNPSFMCRPSPCRS